MIERQAGTPPMWSAYPSWGQFAWLFAFSLFTVFRALVMKKFGLPGWEAWLIGSGGLVICAAALRRWARYVITPDRVFLENGYTGREIRGVAAEQIGEVGVQQGVVGSLLGIGAVVVRDHAGEERLRFKGVADPDIVKHRILALKSVRPATEEHVR